VSIHASGNDHDDQHRNRHPEAVDQRKQHADRTPQLGNFREQDWPYPESAINPELRDCWPARYLILDPGAVSHFGVDEPT
jgi:hypothetical protein